MNFGALFTNSLLVLAVLGGLFYPFFALMVYTTFAILRPTFLWHWADWPTHRHSFYVGVVLLLGWAISGFGNWSGIRNARVPMIGLAIYLGMGLLLTLGVAQNKTVAWIAFDPQWKIGIIALVYLSMIRTENQMRIFAWVITASLGYVAWVFNSQYYFDGYNRVFVRGFAGIDNNGVGMIMAMAAPLSFFMAMQAKRWPVKVGALMAALMQIHVVMFSFSRGAQLGLAVIGLSTFIVALATLPKKGLVVVGGIVVLVFTLWFAGNEVRQEFMSIFADDLDRSAASRFDTWGAAWEAIKDKPLGRGPRQFNMVSHEYGLAYNKSVHNLFLQTGADYGIPGMIGLGMFYIGTAWQTLMMAFSPTARRLRWPAFYGAMVSIALGGFLVCSMFIGMESVELGYHISLLGILTVGFVKRVEATAPQNAANELPELELVPLPDRAMPA